MGCLRSRPREQVETDGKKLQAALAAAQRQRLSRMQLVPIVAVGIGVIISVARPVSAAAMHGVVMEACAMRMIAKANMIATDPAHVSAHGHAADMSASAEADVRTAVKAAELSTAADTADVRASTTNSADVTASATAVTATASTAPRVGRADRKCRGKRSRSQDHQHSFHQNSPCPSRQVDADPCAAA